MDKTFKVAVVGATGAVGEAMPSILAEVSFISNPEDERTLKSEAGRRQIAEALFEGVRSYAETLSGLRNTAARD